MKILKIRNTGKPSQLGYIILPFLLLLFSKTHAQLQEDFTDGDFTINPTWVGTTADFTINATQQLQLNNTVAGSSYITTPHLLIDFSEKEWHFWVRQNFAGSGSNYGRVYLTTNATDLSTNPDGIYIQFGEANTTDAIRLMQRNGGVTTQICASPDGTIAAAFAVGIKINRAISGDWTIHVDYAGGTNYTQTATGTEVAAPIGTNFGYFCLYTATNANRFYLDDIYIGEEILDILPPTMQSITVIDANEIDVLFSEPLDAITAQNSSNYTVLPAIGIAGAILDGTNPALVHLTLATNLTNGASYTLSSENIEDLNGNPSTLSSLPFSYFIAETPVAGDVILTEFFPDPSPAIGLPEIEFVEIYNASTKIFNVNGWKLGDNATYGTLQDAWILPGEYKVLCPIASVSSYPNSIGVTSFPSLNNTSDDVKIEDNTSLVLDQLSYTLEWYHDTEKQDGGWTIERINPSTTCSGINNWKASIDASGGTPGAQNSVYDTAPDLTLPEIVSAIAINANTVEITFNKAVDGANLATTPININPTLTINTRNIVGAFPTSFQLEFDENLTDGTTYQLDIENVSDCWGNTADLTSNFMLPGVPQVGDIIINEFMADPTPVIGLPEVEFVEIYNKSNKTFNITGWKLGDNSSFGTIQNAWLAPGEYKILCATSSLTEYPNAVAVSSFPSFGNANDDIVLQDNNGLELDKISYTLDWYVDMTKKDGGWTIELINPQAPCSQASNWRASTDANGGTPGMQNSVYDLTPDTSAPFVQTSLVTSLNAVEIQFNEPVDSSSLANAILTINPSLTEVNRTISGQLVTNFELQFAEDFAPSQNYQYTLLNIADCWGNVGTISGSFIRASEADSGDIVINEILFDPYTGGSDWVELYNKSEKVINLKNWQLGRLVNGAVADNKTIATNYFLMPDDYIVIGADSMYVINKYPATILGKFYNLSLASMPNDAGSVVLSFPKINGTDTIVSTMDQVQYDDSWHFRLIDSKDGKSLERRDPNLPSQDAKNWYTAAENIGFATPGGQNSQYFPALFSGQVNLSSETISPDNDGFEDLLQINYQMEEAGMLATIQIFDDRGRSIKTLMSNELLGMSGTITWDGIREDGQKARIGTYVLLMEAFNIEGGSEFVSKKAFVVAGKM